MSKLDVLHSCTGADTMSFENGCPFGVWNEDSRWSEPDAGGIRYFEAIPPEVAA
jgi:hypothetical protein